MPIHSTRTAPPRDTRKFLAQDIWIALALFVLTISIYIRTMAPDILMGDSGEFQVMAVTGGLAHGTGYPIYLLIAKLFTFIPIYSIAWRVNFMSAFMGAATVAELFLLCRALGIRRSYSIIGAAMVMINPIFWWQSNIAEVYTLSAAFFLAMLLSLVIWRQDRNPSRLIVAGLIGGLCWGMHHTAVLALPAVLVYLVVSKAKKKDWKMASIGVLAGFAIAMAGYSIMASIENATNAIHSVKPAAAAFGLKSEDFDSIVTQIDFIMNAKEFKSNLSSQSQQLTTDNLSKYWGETSSDFGWPGMAVILAGIGCVFGFKRWRPEGVLFFLAWLTLFLFVLSFDAFDIEVDFLLGYLLLGVFIAAGLQGLHWLFLKSDRASMTVRWLASGVGAVVLAIGVVPTLAGACNALAEAKPTFLKGEDRIMPYVIDDPNGVRDYATFVISQVEGNSLIISEWAREWPFYYIAQFEKNKPDIEVIENPPVDEYGLPPSTYMPYIRAEAAKRPIYSVRIRPSMQPEFDFQEILPGGLYRVVPHTRVAPTRTAP